MTVDRIKGILFDMDGTLFSTQDLVVHCVNETSRKYLGRSLPRDDPLWKFGPPATGIVQQFAGSLPERPIDESVSYYNSIYRSKFRDMAIEFPGIPELLGGLKEIGKSLAIVTSETSDLSSYALETLDLREFFETVVTSNDVKKKKPDPEGVHVALQTIQLTPQECMLIGDSATDITAGKNAGLLTAGALWGGERWGDPRVAKPDYLFSNVGSLRGFFWKLSRPTSILRPK